MALHAGLLLGARAVLSSAARAEEPEAPDTVLALDLRRVMARDASPREAPLEADGGAPLVARDDIPTPTESDLIAFAGPDLEALRTAEEASQDAAEPAEPAPRATNRSAGVPSRILARRGGARQPLGAGVLGGAGLAGGGAPGAGAGSGETGLGSGAGPGAAAVFEPPSLLAAPEPRYPERAHRGGVEGDVVCRLWLDATGAVTDVVVVTSSGREDFDAAACAALAQWRFAPSRRDGEPAPCEVLHTVRFRLRMR